MMRRMMAGYLNSRGLLVYLKEGEDHATAQDEYHEWSYVIG